MRLVSYRNGDALSTGALLGDRLVDLPQVCGAPGDMIALLKSPLALAAARSAVERLANSGAHRGFRLAAGVSLLPPVTRPGKIIGVGMNYAFGQAVRPPFPILFERNAGSLVGPGQAIRLPRDAHQVAIECELVLVIGSGGKHIPAAQALDALAGFTLANDVTARDLERRTPQWTSGKLLDAFLPLGPAVVTIDEVPDVADLQLRAWINGDPVLDGPASDMLYSPAELVAYISSLITLEAGDLILTGSPKRLGDLPAREVYLQAGDQVRIEITDLGVLENPVKEETDD